MPRCFGPWSGVWEGRKGPVGRGERSRRPAPWPILPGAGIGERLASCRGPGRTPQGAAVLQPGTVSGLAAGSKLS